MKSFIILFILFLLYSCKEDATDPSYIISKEVPDIPVSDFPEEYELTFFSPDSGKTGRYISLYGKAFGFDIDPVFIKFGDRYARIISIVDTCIVAEVPNIALGEYNVSVIVKDSILVYDKKFKVSEYNYQFSKFYLSAFNLVCLHKYHYLYCTYYGHEGDVKNIIDTEDTISHSFHTSMNAYSPKQSGDTMSFGYDSGTFEYMPKQIASFVIDEYNGFLRDIIFLVRYSNIDGTSYDKNEHYYRIEKARITVNNDSLMQIVLDNDDFKSIKTDIYNERRKIDIKSRVRYEEYYDYYCLDFSEKSEVVISLIKVQ